MAKERINRLKEPRKPFKFVILKFLKKLTYLFILMLFAGLIYIIDSSDLFEPKISWEVDGNLTTETAQYDRLIKPLLNNKYLINLSQLKEKVEQHPWVAKAEVSRLFWNKIRIAVVNHESHKAKWKFLQIKFDSMAVHVDGLVQFFEQKI